MLAACDDRAMLGSQADDAAITVRSETAPTSTADAAAPVDRAEDTALPGRDAEAGLDASAAAHDDGLDARTAGDDASADALVPAASEAGAADAAHGDVTGADAASNASTAARDYAVGTARIEMTARNNRNLTLQLWYPAVEAARAEASAGHPMIELEAEGPRRALLERLLKDAPERCANRTMHAAHNAAPIARATPFPLLVFSHHLEGMRVALFSLAEAMARLGFVVAGPDHTPWTLYDRTDDLKSADLLATALRFDPGQFAVRADDIQSVIDLMLDAGASNLPVGIRGKIDPARIGMFGHSAGSITAGIVTAREPRIRASAFIAFPPAAVLSLLNIADQPSITDFHVPALFTLAQEDASLNTVGGNDAIREQFDAYPASAYLVEVRNAGHWSFADDNGLIPDFADGCGKATRTSDGSEASYENLDGARVRELTAQQLASFFGSQFLGGSNAALEESSAAELVVRSHGSPVQK
jgi:hypothetical protein